MIIEGTYKIYVHFDTKLSLTFEFAEAKDVSEFIIHYGILLKGLWELREKNILFFKNDLRLYDLMRIIIEIDFEKKYSRIFDKLEFFERVLLELPTVPHDMITLIDVKVPKLTNRECKYLFDILRTARPHWMIKNIYKAELIFEKRGIVILSFDNLSYLNEVFDFKFLKKFVDESEDEFIGIGRWTYSPKRKLITFEEEYQLTSMLKRIPDIKYQLDNHY